MSLHTLFRRPFAVLVALAGLALTTDAARGQKPAAKKYPFASPPLEVYDRLGKANLGKVEPLADGDRKFLAEFWAARPAKPAKDIPPADDAAVTAHLIASGVSSLQARAEYLLKFNDLVARAETATAGAMSDPQKADRLLRFLHKE